MSGPPRIAPLAVTELTDELLAVVEPLIAINAAVDSRDAEALVDLVDGGPEVDRSAIAAALPELVRTMLRHPALFACLAATGVQLLVRGVLPARDRELAILRIAWLCQAPYEFGEHVLIAAKVGVSGADVDRIRTGSIAPGWSPRERAVLRAVEELRDTATIDDGTWAALASHYDARQLIELPILVGQYQAVACYQNALRLRLHEGNDGLSAR